MSDKSALFYLNTKCVDTCAVEFSNQMFSCRNILYQEQFTNLNNHAVGHSRWHSKINAMHDHVLYTKQCKYDKNILRTII